MLVTSCEMNFNEKLQFSSQNHNAHKITCHKINPWLILVVLLRFQSLIDFMASQSGMMSSF